ncbi:MAG TPA: ATP-binding cassette domain-containing protein [Alphaproteobacteria bacterium]|nr:ATP-binding cassette domain-containing protein [Alphaproteobacteria bacterium]
MSLAVEGLDVDIGATRIIRGAQLVMSPGAMCGLIGLNGAGKTTFMRSVMGFLKPRAGTIRFGDAELDRLPPFARARLGIGYMPEDRKLMPDFTVEDNVLLPALAVPRKDAAERLDWIYGLMPEIVPFKARRASQLSGGQQKMVALARALMCGTKLLLLDEPFEGLAPALARRLGEVLAKLPGSGLSVLMAESNETHVGDLLDEVFVIDRGTIARRAGPAPMV